VSDLIKRPESPLERLKDRYEKAQEKDLTIVAAMNRFSEVPTEAEAEERKKLIDLLVAGTPDELKAAGWRSRKELRMAIYGTMPKKEWPAAMQAAHERVGMRIRRQDKAPGRQVFNLNMISIPAPKPAIEAKVVIVEPEER